jgi:transposase
MAELECTRSIGNSEPAILIDESERGLRLFLGIDISKRDFHAALLAGDLSTVKSFPNNSRGFRQLASWLRRSKAAGVHACMEATGIYWEKLAAFLHGEQHDVSVTNPSQIKAFAASELLRVKTDSADAGLIARFCRANRPDYWAPPAPGVRELQTLVRRLEALKGDRHQQISRCADATREPEIRALIRSFDRAIKETERRIRLSIQNNDKMREQSDLLCSIPGVAEKTAAVLMAEVFLRSDFSGAKQVVAYAGLAPRIRQSGTSLRSKGGLSKSGNSRVRKCLFFPAIVGSTRNPALKAFAGRLASKGKPKMSVVGALMRKLLVLCYGVLKSGVPFNAAIAA